MKEIPAGLNQFLKFYSIVVNTLPENKYSFKPELQHMGERLKQMLESRSGFSLPYYAFFGEPQFYAFHEVADRRVQILDPGVERLHYYWLTPGDERQPKQQIDVSACWVVAGGHRLTSEKEMRKYLTDVTVDRDTLQWFMRGLGVKNIPPDSNQSELIEQIPLSSLELRMSLVDTNHAWTLAGLNGEMQARMHVVRATNERVTVRLAGSLEIRGTFADRNANRDMWEGGMAADDIYSLGELFEALVLSKWRKDPRVVR